MADPVVHITNGIPDVGTGNITTLGQTLLDGANLTLGSSTDLAVTAGAAGSMNAHLRSISRDIAGGVVLQSGGNVIGAVTQSGGPWSISGSVSITGSVTVTGTVGATQSGTWNVNNISGTITLPTGAATSAKQPNFGTAGVPSADVLTIQGATSMTPLKVDGSGVTQPVSGNVGITGNVNVVQVTSPWVTSVSGTVAVVQSGTWSNRVVGNAGGIFDFASTQNVATPAQALLVGAEFNAVPTTIVTGNSSPLQMDSAANLLVNVKTGTVAATQSGVWSTRVQDGSGTAITSTGGALDINIKSGGGGGGTASAFGSAFPASGTAIGAKDSTGTNMVSLNVNASGALKVDGSAVTQPVSGTVTANIGTAGTLALESGGNLAAIKTDVDNLNLTQGAATAGQKGNLPLGAVTTGAPTYTTGQSNPLSLTTAGALRVDGSAITQPVSGTVTVQQGTASNLKVDLSGTAANATAIKVDGSAVTQPVSGTITANIGTSGSLALEAGGNLAAIKADVDNLNLAQASTTLGQKGNLSFGATTTAAPSYTTAQSNPLSLTTAGALRVDGSAVTQPVSVAAAVTVQQSVAANLKVDLSGTAANATAIKVDGSAVTQPVSIASAVTVAQATAANLKAQVDPLTAGNWGLASAAQNVATPTNGVLAQGQFNTTPTTITSGNISPLQVDNAGNLKVNIQSGGGSGGTASSFGTSFPASGTAVGAKDSTGTNMVPLNLDASGNLKVAVTGAGSGGTSAVDEAAFTAGTSAFTPSGGFFQTTATNNALTNGQQGVWQLTAQRAGFVNLRNASGTEIGTATTPVRDAPDGTIWAMTGTSANVNVTNASIAVTGTFFQATQPISATSLPLPSGAATSANQPSNSAIGATTSGQTGTLAMGATTTGAPTYTTAQSNPLSLTTAGALRVDNSAVTQPISGNVGITGSVAVTGTFWQATQPVSIAAAVTVAQATAANLNATVTGTVAATQSGTWNVNNISGTISLPTGAATSANQPTAAALGSTTSGQTGNLALGAVTTAAPTYVTAQSNALSLTTAGALRVDNSAVTQPVSGTVAVSSVGGSVAVTGTFWQATQPVSIAAAVTVAQATAGNLNATVVGTGTFAVQLTGATNNINNISGTVSLPTGAATAANQTNVQGVIGNATAPASMIVTGGVFNTTRPTLTTGQSAAFQSNNNGVQLVDGSTVTQPVSIAAAVTVQQSTASNLKVDLSGTAANATAIKVDGSAVTQPVSIAAAVTVAQATAANLKGQVDPLTIGSWGLAASTQNVATPTNGMLVQGEFNTTPTAITSGNTSPLQLDTNGNLKVNIMAGAGSGGTASSVGGALPGQGTLALGSVTTAAPSYTTATANSLSLTTAGALRVDNSAVTQPVSGTFWQATQPVSISATVNVSAAQSGNWTSRTVGNTGAIFDAAQNAAAPANELVVGGVYNSSAPTLTSGNASQLQLDVNGNLNVNIKASIAQAVTQSGNWSVRLQDGAGTAITSTSSALDVNVKSTVTQSVGGDVASGSSDSGNPVKIGGQARTTNPTAVTSGQRVNAIFDKLGKQIVVGAIRDLKGVQKTSITAATETTVVTAGAAGVFQDVYAIIITNKSATSVFVDIKDATAGTTRMTLSAPAGDTRGFTVPVDSAMVQAAAANNWTATVSSAVTSIEITMLYVSNT